MTTSNNLNDKTICITGASSGIGQAIAQHLGSSGAHVFMMGRNRSPMDESADLIRSAGGSADVAFDVADPGSPVILDRLQGHPPADSM